MLSDLYYARYWTEAAFLPLNPTVETRVRRLLFGSILYLPGVSLIYALAGVWVFRSRGCTVFGCAVMIAACSLVAQLAQGLGRL